MRQTFSFEGCYATDLGLNLCVRQETGGVPRFVNIFIRNRDLREYDADEVLRFAHQVLKLQRTSPLPADDMLPGIG